MTKENLYQSLDSELDAANQRQELVTFLKEIRDNLPEDREDRRKIAYMIAGFMSTRFARSLDVSDTLDQILVLAGELEAPDDDVDNKWLELCKLVEDL